MSDGANPNNGTILVVDDDPAALNYLAALLRKEGFGILLADSGYNAFTQLEKRARAQDSQTELAAIICDWKMPGWDGLKLRTELLNTPYRDVPFLLMSGAVTRGELEAAARRGLTGVVLKPVNRDILVRKLRELIANRASS